MVLLRNSNGPFAKDACHFCFATQFDSLFVSTATNRAYCQDHLKLHQSQYPDDQYYVQLTKAKKAKDVDDGERQHKILKLEINYAKESESFHTDSKLIRYIDGTISIVPEQQIDQETSEIINKVLTATSSSKAQELKSWQLEIQPCPHTISYQGPSETPQVDLADLKCSSCELDQNLWLCLVCGSLGCGRAQFGGVPGNTHALSHSEATGHAIAVKLGSLDKDIADIYCYSCDEEVSFPNVDLLQNALSLFGIDLNTFEKKEKGLMELQIEQNLEWEFNLKDSEGNQLAKVFGEGLTGLRNLGNTCYLNSVMQLLFCIPEYQERFNQEIVDEKDGEEDLQFELVKLANGLLSGRFSKPNDEENDGYQKGISPDSIKYKVSQGHEEFETMRQQDAMEFFSYLLEKIDKIDPTINDIFRYVNIEKLKFGDNTIKLKKQIAGPVTLPLAVELQSPGSDSEFRRESFLESLHNYLKPEEIELNNKPAFKSNFFATFPKYLITSIQRIQLKDGWNPVKVDVPLSIPAEFDIRSMQSKAPTEPNEIEIQDDDEDEEFEEFKPNEVALEQLQAMGFPLQRAKRALFENNNNTNVEEVMDWLFQRMDDDSLDAPFDFKVRKTGSDNNSNPSVDQDKVSSLVGMGFSSQSATKALVLNNHDVNAAVEWLFSNPDDDGELPKEEQHKDTLSEFEKIEKLVNEDSGSSKYVLKGVICHKGSQVTSGHYVVFLKNESDGRWVLFNDEKVVDVTGDDKSWSEVERNGYVYLWKRV